MKIQLPSFPPGDWHNNAGTVYTGSTGFFGVFRKGTSSPVQFHGPEIQAISTACAALPDLLQALADALTEINWHNNNGTGYQNTRLEDSITDALQKAGCQIS